jgi:CheY-like chemotaxis protein
VKAPSKKALEADTAFDAILMDINLVSGIDGTQAADRILKSKDIPIIFVSSHIEPEIVRRTENITSYGYVIKTPELLFLTRPSRWR